MTNDRSSDRADGAARGHDWMPHAPAPGMRTVADARERGFEHHVRGDFTAAAADYATADLSTGDDAELAIFHAAVASTEWARGDLAGCRAETERAMQHAQRSGDDRALGWAWVSRVLLAGLDGDPHAEGHAFSRAIRHAGKAGDISTQVRALVNLGWRLTDAGHHERALSQLDRAFRLLTEIDEPLTDAVARYNMGLALLGLGRLDEALERFEECRRRYVRLGAPQLRAALLGIGSTHAAMGNASRAAAAYREVVRLSESNGSTHTLVAGLAGLARATVVDDPAECDAALDRAMAQPHHQHSVDLALAAGWVALARGLREVALEHGRRVELEAGRREHLAGMAEALELVGLAGQERRVVDRLAEARMIWIETRSVVRSTVNEVVAARIAGEEEREEAARSRLRSLGIRDDADRIAGPLMVLGSSTQAAIDVHVLGSLGLRRAGRELRDEEWPSDLSRTALEALAAAPGCRLPQAEVLRRVALDADGGEVVAADVLEELRGVLDPEGVAPDRGVHDEAGVWSLATCVIAVDADRFRRAARDALAHEPTAADGGVEALEEAVALYTGRLLDGRTERDWVLDARAELRGLSRALRFALAERRPAEPDLAVPWLAGLVYEDPYDAVAQLALVRAMGAAGRSAEAELSYADYTSRMREIGRDVEPMPVV